MKTKPFSENIVFLDTEFSDLDPYKGEIISIGIIKLNGEEFYAEIEHEKNYTRWVRKNVLPYFSQERISRHTAIKRIKKFIGSDFPHPVCFVPQFDIVYLYKLFGTKRFPFNHRAIDIASILFSIGISPTDFEENEEFLKKYNIEKRNYRKHHSLDDARMLRDFYINYFNLKIDEKRK